MLTMRDFSLILPRQKYRKKGDAAYADDMLLDINSHVSMNMWGFAPEFIGRLERALRSF